jgi:glycosyltransferase involved in cell wall biosynthesis
LLAKEMVKRDLHVEIATFYDDNTLSNVLEKYGVNVISLSKKSRWDMLSPLLELVKLLNRQKNLLLFSFMTSANIVAILLKLLIPKQKVIIGIRASNMSAGNYDTFTRLTVWVETQVMRFANAVIFNSHSAKDLYQSSVKNSKAFVIHNAVDSEKFQLPVKQSTALREKFSIADDTKIIGVVARVDPMKGYSNLFLATFHLLKYRKDFVVLCVASGSESEKSSLKQKCEMTGVSDHFIFLDPTDKLEFFYPQLDLLALTSSFGEGLPNVLIEAMACGTKCVATDVGDVNKIIFDKTAIVAPDNPIMLAHAMNKHLDKPLDKNDKRRLRKHMTQKFSLEKMVTSTLRVIYGV